MDNRKIAKNAMFLYARMGLLMLVHLFYSRELLSALGIDDYGVYQAVCGVAFAFGFFCMASTMASQRFLTFAIGKKDSEQLSSVFRESFNLHFAIVLLTLVLGETLGLWFLNFHVKFPPNSLFTANVVYQLLILSLCSTVISIPYKTLILANERMEFFAYLSIAEALSKLIIVLFLFLFPSERLELYAALLFLCNIFFLLCHKYYCNKHFAESFYHWKFDKDIFCKLVNFSGWNILTHFAAMTTEQGLVLLLNIFHGIVVNAAMGIAMLVRNATNQFLSNFQLAYQPQIVKLYAEGNINDLFKLIIRSSKFSFFLLFMIIVPVILYMDFLLAFWLKEVPDNTSIFCKLLLIDILFWAWLGPLWMSIHATGFVKKFQISLCIINLLIPMFSYVLLANGFLPETVLYVRIASDFLDVFVHIYFAHVLFSLPVWNFLSKVFIPSILVILISISLPILFNEHFLFIPCFILAILLTGLSREERTASYLCLNSKMHELCIRAKNKFN
jgi:Na+-driven multidrug efflux pump